MGAGDGAGTGVPAPGTGVPGPGLCRITGK